jgi:hypothetical protein
MRVIKLAGRAVHTAARADGRLTSDIDGTRRGRRLLVIVDGEATVGPDATPVAKLDAVELDAGEAATVRATTEVVQWWELEFE